MEALKSEVHILMHYLAYSHVNSKIKIAALQSSITALTNHYEHYRRKVIYECATNNWLKLHGYPMRRKAHN